MLAAMRWIMVAGAVAGAVASAVAGVGTFAAADPAPVPPAPPINLLLVAPSVVAVSSSVANGAILPEHLVDGDLKTAWNSRTGELVGAWIAVRVPTTAHVTSIRMTAGFTRADKGGDLFTMNPRIRKVRVSGGRDSKRIEMALDPDVRGLQDIPVDGRGGDFVIEVLDVLPGSKAAWRELSVSELEVWGTLDPKQAPVKSRPAVRVGSLDALPAPGYAACQKFVVPTARGGHSGPDATDDWITSWDAVGLGHDLAVCRIDHRAAGSTTTTVELAAVNTAKKTVLGRQTSTSTEDQSDQAMQMSQATGGKLEISRYPLTAAENALLVEVSASTGGPQFRDSKTTSTLYRILPAGFVPILDFASSEHSGETYSLSKCALSDPPDSEKAFPRLTVGCEEKSTGFQDSSHASGDSRHRYLWDGAKYVDE